LQQKIPRALMSRGVEIYFVVLCVLTGIAFSRDAITWGLLLLIVPGLILIVSGTLLVYSLALLPAYLIYRHLGKRLLAGVAAVFSLAATAVLPHYIDGYLLSRLIASDVSDPPTSFKPRSFELPYQSGDIYWTNGRARALTRPAPPCADLCQQLLFNGNIDQIFVFGDSSEDPFTRGTLVFTGGKAYLIPEGSKRTFRPVDLSHDSSVQEIPVERAEHPIQKWRRFRLQQQEICPAVPSIIAAKFAPEVAAGRCLIEEVVDSANADVVVSISEAPPAPKKEPTTDSCQSLPYRGIQTGPTTVTLAERRNGRLIPVEIKTALEAQYVAIPFYFGVRFFGGGLASACPGTATDPFPRSYADPFEMISRRYGFQLAQTPWSGRPQRSR
jgi:hypothetical protein